jgi:hypothetical protein
MARKVRDAALDSREARRKLKVRGRPYWRAIGKGLHLGYRRIANKDGTWWRRAFVGGAGDGAYALEALVPRDNQGETAASIRMRMRRGWTVVARA